MCLFLITETCRKITNYWALADFFFKRFDLCSEVRKKCQLCYNIFWDCQSLHVVKWRVNRSFEDRPCRRRHQGSNSVTSSRHDILAHILGHGGEAKRFGGRNEVLLCVVLLARKHFIELVVVKVCSYTSLPLRGVICKAVIKQCELHVVSHFL